MSITLPTNGVTSGNISVWPIAVTVPTGIQQGDFCLVTFTSGTALTGVTAPTGWSQTSLGNIAHTSLFTQAWWHIAGASEPTTWAFNSTTNTTPAQWLATLYRGVNQATPLDTAWTTATGSTTPDTCPAITTVTTGAMVVDLLMSVNNIHWTAPVTTPPTTLLQSTGGGNDTFTENNLASGVLASRTFTPSGTSGLWNSASIALRPLVGTAHTALSGSGSIGISNPAAVLLALTTQPASLGVGPGNPPWLFKVGNIAWGTTNGPLRNEPITHQSELIIAPFSTASVMYYAFAPGVVATITELSTP